jgi:hypothetical protein
MQGSYEKDIRNLTEVLSKVSENAPKEEIAKKLDKLND